MDFPRNISRFVIVMLLLSFFVYATAQNSFSFAFLTDIHFDGSQEHTENLLKAIELSVSLDCDFIITGGDNLDAEACFMHPDSATGCYHQYDSIVNTASVPVYSAIGNHDRYLFTETNDPDYDAGLFKTHTGLNDYYSFDYNDWHFIVVNNVCFDDNLFEYQVSDEQLYWLEQDLLRTRQSIPIVLIVHVPLVSVWKPFIRNRKPRKKVLEEYRELWDRFKGYDLAAVLQGHYHIWKTSSIKGVPYITGGAVNTSWWSPLFNTKPGIIVATCNETTINYQYKELNEK